MSTSKGQCCQICVTTRGYSPDGENLWEKNFGTDTVDMYVYSGDLHVIGDETLNFQFLAEHKIKGTGIQDFIFPFSAYIYNDVNYKRYSYAGQELNHNMMEALPDMDKNYYYIDSFNLMEYSGNAPTENSNYTSAKYSYKVEKNHSSHKKARCFYYNSGLYLSANNKIYKYQKYGTSDYKLNTVFFNSNTYDSLSLHSGKLFFANRYLDAVIDSKEEYDVVNSSVFDFVDVYFNYPTGITQLSNCVDRFGLHVNLSAERWNQINSGLRPIGNVVFNYSDASDSFQFDFYINRAEINWKDGASCLDISSPIFGGETVWLGSSGVYNSSTACGNAKIVWDIYNVTHDAVLGQHKITLKKYPTYSKYNKKEYRYSTVENVDLSYYHIPYSSLVVNSVIYDTGVYFSDTYINWIDLDTFANNPSGIFKDFSNDYHINYVLNMIESYNSGYLFTYTDKIRGTVVRETGVCGNWKITDTQIRPLDYSNGSYLFSVVPKIKIKDNSSDYEILDISAGARRETQQSFSAHFLSESCVENAILNYKIAYGCFPHQYPPTGNPLRHFKTRFYIDNIQTLGSLSGEGYPRDYFSNSFYPYTGNCYLKSYKDKSEWRLVNSDNIITANYGYTTYDYDGSGLTPNGTYSLFSTNSQSHLYVPSAYNGNIDLVPNLVDYDGNLTPGQFTRNLFFEIPFGFPLAKIRNEYGQEAYVGLINWINPNSLPFYYSKIWLIVTKDYGSSTANGYLTVSPYFSIGSGVTVVGNPWWDTYLSPLWSMGFPRLPFLNMTYEEYISNIAAQNGTALIGTALPYIPSIFEVNKPSTSTEIQYKPTCVSPTLKLSAKLEPSDYTVDFGSVKHTYISTGIGEWIFSLIDNIELGGFVTTYGTVINYESGYPIRWTYTEPTVAINGCTFSAVGFLHPFFMWSGTYTPDGIDPALRSTIFFHPFSYGNQVLDAINPLNYVLADNRVDGNGDFKWTWDETIYTPRVLYGGDTNQSFPSPIGAVELDNTLYPPNKVELDFISGQLFSGINYNLTSCPTDSTAEYVGNMNYYHIVGGHQVNIVLEQFGYYIKEYSSGFFDTFYGPHAFMGPGWDGYGSGHHYHSGVGFFQGYQRNFNSGNWLFGSSGVEYIIETGNLSKEKKLNSYQNYSVLDEEDLFTLEFNRNSMNGIR